MSDSNESQLEINLSNDSLDNSVELPNTAKQKAGKIYKQFYRKAWEEIPEFKEWLTSIPSERSLAYCKICQKTLHAHRLSLTKHTVSLKHTRLAQRKAYEDRSDDMESSSSPSDNVQILTGPQSGHDYTLIPQNDEQIARTPDAKPSPSSATSAPSLQHDSLKTNHPAVPAYQKRALNEKPPITTHVLDISKGVPAAGLAVSLYQLIDGRWTIIKDGHTNGDGRCNTLTSPGSIKPGRYKLHFDTDRYFVMHRQATFFPFVEVVFDVCSPDERNHVPVLLSPYGYQTYRGS